VAFENILGNRAFALNKQVLHYLIQFTNGIYILPGLTNFSLVSFLVDKSKRKVCEGKY